MVDGRGWRTRDCSVHLFILRPSTIILILSLFGFCTFGICTFCWSILSGMHIASFGPCVRYFNIHVVSLCLNIPRCFIVGFMCPIIDEWAFHTYMPTSHYMYMIIKLLLVISTKPTYRSICWLPICSKYLPVLYWFRSSHFRLMWRGATKPFPVFVHIVLSRLFSFAALGRSASP